MVPFKPAEIRIIVVLSLLALAGSFVTLLERQGKLDRLDLAKFSGKTGYNYSYRASSLPAMSRPESTLVSSVPADSSGVSEKISLNNAGLFDFESLPGIGPVIAGRIVAYRDSVGRFSSVEDLLKVKGIGPAKLAAIRDRVALE